MLAKNVNVALPDFALDDVAFAADLAAYRPLPPQLIRRLDLPTRMYRPEHDHIRPVVRPGDALEPPDKLSIYQYIIVIQQMNVLAPYPLPVLMKKAIGFNDPDAPFVHDQYSLVIRVGLPGDALYTAQQSLGALMAAGNDGQEGTILFDWPDIRLPAAIPDAGPAVLMGDLNTPATHPQLIVLRHRPDVRSALHDGMPDGPSADTIDWLFHRGLTTVSAQVVDVTASDHPVLFAELALPDDNPQ